MAREDREHTRATQRITFGTALPDPVTRHVTVAATAMHVSDDRDAAAVACRWAPAACANHITDMARNNPNHDVPEIMMRLLRARDAYDYYGGHLDSSARHSADLTTDLVHDFATAGPVERCLSQLRALADIGMDELSVAYNNGSFEQMERVGSEIVPVLAGLTVARYEGSS